MTYVEWLRIRNCLRNTAIVLGVLLALAVILRVSLARYTSPAHWIGQIQARPGVRTTHTTLPNGTKRTILDDPSDQTHVVIDDRGDAGEHIVVTEPSSRAHHDEDTHVSVGSIRVSESRNGSMTTTVTDTNGAVPIVYYMGLADVVALIVATILAAPLAREIDGHLEITLTKPISRARYALGAIGVDVVAIITASVMTVAALYICQLLFESPKLDFSGVNDHSVLMGVAMPLAWYAMLCAATTWVSRGYGAVLGFAWPVALLVWALTLVRPTNLVARFVHDVASVLSRFDPLTYVSLAKSNGYGGIAASPSDATFGLRVMMEVLFFVVYSALAIWRWQRVEA
jgi:ABC-type transport system involved in multi-copper enzyme maturation permease subunit